MRANFRRISPIYAELMVNYAKIQRTEINLQKNPTPYMTRS